MEIALTATQSQSSCLFK